MQEEKMGKQRREKRTKGEERQKEGEGDWRVTTMTKGLPI